VWKWCALKVAFVQIQHITSWATLLSLRHVPKRDPDLLFTLEHPSFSPNGKAVSGASFVRQKHITFMLGTCLCHGAALKHSETCPILHSVVYPTPDPCLADEREQAVASSRKQSQPWGAVHGAETKNHSTAAASWLTNTIILLWHRDKHKRGHELLLWSTLICVFLKKKLTLIRFNLLFLYFRLISVSSS